MDSAEDVVDEVTAKLVSSPQGSVLKNALYDPRGWFVANTSMLARERFRQFKANIKRIAPGWDDRYTVLLVSEALMEPREHMPGVKALEIPFNAILRLNADALGLGELPPSFRERVFGRRLVGHGITVDDDELIRQKCERNSNEKHNGGARG